MNNEEFRQLQYSLFVVFAYNLALLIVVKYSTGFSKESLLLAFMSLIGVSFISLVSMIMLRGWMPKDRNDQSIS